MARLNFKETTLTSFDLQPTDRSGLKSILHINTRLTPEIADLLKCSYAFDGAGNPREHIDSFALDIKLRDIDFVVPSATIDGQWEEWRCELVWKFKIKKEDDFRLNLEFRVHISGDGRWREIGEFAEAFCKRNFECAIRSLQTDFDFTAENPGGTAVDMSADDSEDDEPARDANGKLFVCQHCQAGLQLDAGGATHTTSDGEVVPCADVPFKANAPALASAAQMGAKRKKRTVRAINEAEVAETVTVD
jgi:hypothetical protein